MKNREEIQQELQELSPFLSKLKAKEQKTEVPENYFHALPDQIWEQIKLQPASERIVKQAGIWEKFLNALQLVLQPRIGVSLATFVVLIFVGIYLFKPDTSVNTANGNEFTAEEITNYINENLHEFDTELLIQATADLPNQSILPADEFSEEEIDQLMEEILKDLDEKTLEEMF
jgi:hypothetical protein